MQFVVRYVRLPLLNRHKLLIQVLFLLLVFIEECYIGFMQAEWKKAFSHTVYLPITVKRTTDGKQFLSVLSFFRISAPQIAIVSIVYDNKKLYEYSLAEMTVACYATLHNYTLIKLNLKDNPKLVEKCPGKDVSGGLEEHKKF